MRFLIDNALSPRLRPPRAADTEIFEYAAAERRIIVSADTDFATILAARNVDRPSVVLYRRRTDRRPEEQTGLLLANLDTIVDELDAGAVVVFEPGRIRVRRLPFGG